MARKNRSERRKASRERRELEAAVKAVTDFYIEVAKTLDLPPKALAVAPVAPPPPPQTREEVLREIEAKRVRAQYRRWWLPALALLLFVVMGVYKWWPAGPAAVPEGFRGTWISQNASYAGRKIVISMETIEIVSGRSAATGPRSITSLRIDTTTAGVRLRLVYGTAGTEQPLEMTLHPGRPATLTLPRPANVVWERVEGAPAAPPGN